MKRQNIDNPTEVNAGRNWDRSDKQFEDISWRETLKSENGRRVIWSIISGFCKTYHPTPDLDHAQLARRAGMRDVGLLVEEECLKANPEMFEQMRKESIAAMLDRMNRTTGAKKDAA